MVLVMGEVLGKEKRPEAQWFQVFLSGGLDRDRTGDLTDANRPTTLRVAVPLSCYKPENHWYTYV